jgi:HEPN domain-containing protein
MTGAIMGLPKAPEARLFYRVAKERLPDARLLRESGRSTGSVYLAGYAVECILKSLVLSRLTGKSRSQMLNSFRGVKGHNFGWLRKAYISNRGEALPEAIRTAFTRVNSWSTELRYQALNIRQNDVESFWKAAEAILNWAETRL